jgi:hypothetical protein
MCFLESPTAVTFRAEITSQLSAPQLMEFLGEWVSSGTPVLVQAQILSIDRSCDVVISSFNEVECTRSEVTATGIDATLIGVIAGVLVVMLSVIAVVFTTLMLFRRNKKRGTLELQPVEM